MVVTSSTKPSWRLGAGDQYNCQYCLVSSLMAWMLGQSALSASLKVFATKLGQAADPPDGCAATQSDLQRLEKRAYSYRMKFGKDKCKILPLLFLGRNNIRYLGAKWLGSSLVEEDLGGLVDIQLTMSQRGSQGQQHPGLI